MAERWFKARFTWGKSFEMLDDAEIVSLVRAIWKLEETGETMPIEGKAAFIWPMIAEEIRQDIESRENGMKGGRPPKNSFPNNPGKNPPFNPGYNPPLTEPEPYPEPDKEPEKDKENDKEKKRKRFSPPTPDEVNEYGRENGYAVDGQRFCDFYASKGWKVGNTPMKDWQAAVRTWARKDAPEAAPKPKSKFDGLNLSTVL